ncbi:hypothetical protein [Paenibacillus bouchesdurhonensis]|uniref:hypothetical protein n=1 Tax=Paenibacillus bouchesdurhonensis TaxID=1870990 RepID=UPI000DA61AD5|nr:hypothetical protein [Paenibacillus bouchesdurhonensis]
MQNRNKIRSLAITALVILGITITPPVEANHPLIVSLNGQQLKSRFEVNNGQVYAPLLPLAAELGYKVNWNRQSAQIDIVTDSASRVREQSVAKITSKQVADWIVEQGAEDRYYVEGLSFELLDLDGDGEVEIVAAIDGGVHLGNYFIFKKASDGEYQMVFESRWKVDSLKLGEPIQVGDKLLYETLERTGGTGLDVEIAHLWYIEQGQVVEAWKGAVKEMNAMIPDSYSMTVAGYRIQDDQLYYWRTLSLLEDDAETLQGTPDTRLTMFTFDGASFIQK